ncbi:MAG: hypothetical protein M3Y87_07600 [Myxococcota bacterium]|nr:hypothetical protein [Myxococcota bacterium]
MAVALGCVVLPFALAALGQPISARGVAWVVLGMVAVVALAIGGTRGRVAAGLAVGAWISVIVATLAWPLRDDAFLRAIVLPSGEAAGAGGRVFAERDISLVGVRLLRLRRGFSDRELEGFVPALTRAYDEIDRDAGEVASVPFLSTLFGRQSAARFDAFVHEEDGTERWLVFLHGYGGSFVAQCWAVARIAADVGVSTICPATTIAGRWDLGDGPAIVRRTLEEIRARGAASIVLAGLSNGGIGASNLATALGTEIDGLALLSGLDSRATPPRVPTLVWHGIHDERFRIDRVREWAATLPQGELIEVDGDHFALLEQRDELAEALSGFLAGIGDRRAR